jgi:hypothetical protein
MHHDGSPMSMLQQQPLDAQEGQMKGSAAHPVLSLNHDNKRYIRLAIGREIPVFLDRRFR